MSITVRTYDPPGSASPVGYTWGGLNTNNMFSSLIRTPPGGMMVNSISVYWAGKGTTAYGYHCIWDAASPGNLVVNSGTVTAGSGSVSAGGQAWHTASVTPTKLQGNKTYFVGVWCNPNYDRVWTQWSYGAVNTIEYQKTDTTFPATFGGSTTNSGGVVAAYVVGNPIGGKVWNGTSWVDSQSVSVWTGSSWATAQGIYVWNGTSWVDAQ